MGKVSIQELAVKLNMSRNTISKALKNEDTVAEKTRLRVAQEALALGYTKVSPVLMAKLQPQDQLHPLMKYAILMTDAADDDFWRGVIWGITDQIRQTNGICFLVLATKEEVRQNRLPVALTAEPLDGIICLTIFNKAYVNLLDMMGIPIVFFDAPPWPLPTDRHFDIILLEGEQSIHDITIDLIRRGCKRLGFIGDITYSQTILDRYRGFCRALSENSLPVNPEWCLTMDSTYYYNEQRLEDCLDQMGELPDALVCANDHIALRVLQYCKAHGFQVPARVAVTGFDNKKECMFVEPHLTSVNTTNRRLGARLAQQLLWRKQNPNMHRETVVIDTIPCYRASSDR